MTTLRRFNSYLRVHHVHCKRTCPFAPPSHASLSHARPLKMTCLVDTQPLSQNRSSAIAALTDDFIHTARHGPDRTDKACTKPVSHRCNRSRHCRRRATACSKQSTAHSDPYCVGAHVVLRVVLKQIKDLGMGVQVVDGIVAEDHRRLAADFR